MKKSVLLICATLIGGYANNGYATIIFDPDSCYSWACSESEIEQWYPTADPTSTIYRNCANYEVACVYITNSVVGVSSCTSCPPGYSLIEDESAGVTACSATGNPKEDAGGGGYSAYKCTKNCQASNCSSTSWTALRTGYETRTYRSCSATGTSGTCNASTQYRCAAGYYGSSSNGTSGCNPCPEWQNVFANSARTTKVYGTSAAGATAITGCYVVAGTYYDTTGTFKIGSNCQYK